MTVMPQFNKVCSVACTTVFSMGLLLSSTAPAWGLEDTSSSKSAKALAQTDKITDTALADTEIDKPVGQWEEPVKVPAAKPMAMGSGNIQVNTACVGLTSTNSYFGLWKKLGTTKAKCKEGASGQPGERMTRLTCRTATINDGNFDNGLVGAPDECIH